MKDFARGCMRTYLILKEKAAQFNADAEIQALLAEINADDGSTDAFKGAYSRSKAAALKAASFDRAGAGRARPALRAARPADGRAVAGGSVVR